MAAQVRSSSMLFNFMYEARCVVSHLLDKCRNVSMRKILLLVLSVRSVIEFG